MSGWPLDHCEAGRASAARESVRPIDGQRVSARLSNLLGLCALSACGRIGFAPATDGEPGRAGVQQVIRFVHSGSTDLVDFPVPLYLTPSRFEYAAASAGGVDVRFRDASGSLDHEIEAWIPGGTSVVWVRVPLIAAMTSDTKIELVYGDQSTVPRENAAGVWRAGYVGVWHLDEPSGMRGDSSPAGNDLVPESGLGGGLGVFAGGASFVTPQHATTADSVQTGLDLGAAFTIEAWVYPTRLDGSLRRYVLGKNGGAGAHGYALQIDTSGAGVPGRVVGEMSTEAGCNQGEDVASSGSTTIAVAEWRHLAATYENGQFAIHLDGIELASTGVIGGGGVVCDNPIDFALGARPNSMAYYFDGGIDEARVSSVARSADWLAAQVATASVENAFVVYGPAL